MKKTVPSTDCLVSIGNYADRINAQWHKATTSIMELAHLCAEANEELTARQKRQLLERLPFAGATFSKLAQIGRDERLHSAEMQRLLPPNYSAIYEVTLFDDATLDEAIKQNILTPAAKRHTLTKWRRQSKSPHALDKPAANDRFYAAIRLTGELSVEQRKLLDNFLDQIRAACNVVEVVHLKE